MNTPLMIAHCGLDCSACDAYLATIHNDDAQRAQVAALWSELNGVPITPEMINCLGCRANGVKTPFCDALCPIRQCALAKGHATCADCADMAACQTLAAITDNNPEALARLHELAK